MAKITKKNPSWVWTNGAQQVQQSDKFWFPTSLPRGRIFNAENGPGIGEFRGNTSTMTDKRYQICWFSAVDNFFGVQRQLGSSRLIWISCKKQDVQWMSLFGIFNITNRGLKWRDTSPVLVMFKWDITESLFCCSFFVAVPVATKNITTSSTVKTRLTSLFAPPKKGLLDAPHITSIRIIIRKGGTTFFL